MFTTLLTYAGVPAYWIFIGPRPELTLSLVEVDGKWRAIDVANSVIFTASDGRLATVEQIAGDRQLVAEQGPAQYHGLNYIRYFDRFQTPAPPAITRAGMQMVWPRVWFNVKRLTGRGGDAWSMRPPSRETPGSD